MQIYFDESGDGKHEYLLLGALFVPKHHTSFLFNEINKVKANPKFKMTKQELKYNNCGLKIICEVAKKVVDVFLKSTGFFRMAYIKKSAINKSNFGLGKDTDDETLVEARIYKKFSELLIHQDLNCIHHGVMYCDELEIGLADQFVNIMEHNYKKATNFHGVCVPTLSTIQKVKSDDSRHPMMAIPDLLMGAVLNANTKTTSKHKIEFKDYVAKRLSELYGIKNLTNSYWGEHKKFKDYHDSHIVKNHPKFSICFWSPK
jgi:hypothetical protein